jgi:hypothetical protein
MLSKIEGQRLTLAKICIANYCIALDKQAGSVDVEYVVSKVNKEFNLVSENEIKALVSDINNLYHCFINQQVNAINRSGYWKWKLMSPPEAREEMISALVQISECNA